MKTITIPQAMYMEMLALYKWLEAAPIEMTDSAIDDITEIEGDACKKYGTEHYIFALEGIGSEASLIGDDDDGITYHFAIGAQDRGAIVQGA